MIFNSSSSSITGDNNVTITERWRITSTGIFQSNGAQTIQSSSGVLTIQPAGNVVLVRDSGNVGIGTADAITAKVEIRGVRSSSKSELLSLSKFDFGVTRFFQNYSNTFFTNGKSLEVEVESLPLLQLATNNVGNEGKVIFPNGNVGIGTNIPNRKLEIKSSVGNINYVRLQEESSNTDTNGGSMLELCGTRSDGSVGFYGGVFGGRENRSANNRGYLAFLANVGEGTSLTERMRINGDGNVGIANSGFANTRLTITGSDNTSSNFGLVVNNSSNSNLFTVRNDGVATFASSVTARDLFNLRGDTAANNSQSVITFTNLRSGTWNNAQIETVTGGQVWAANLVFRTASVGFANVLTERMRITSEGLILIAGASATGAYTLSLGNATSNTYYQVRSANTDSLYGADTRGTWMGNLSGMQAYINCPSFVPGVDNSTSLGSSSYRWTAVYAVNGSIQTSDERQKTNIQTSDLGLDFIIKLNPVSYKWIIGRNDTEYNSVEDETGRLNPLVTSTPVTGVRTHYGLIAQHVKEILGDKDFGGFVHDQETDVMSLRYDQFISPLIKAIQEQQSQIQELKAKIEILEQS
jgi:hypothetical protein